MLSTKALYARLPSDVLRAVKVDVAQRDMTLQDWILEAVLAKLPTVRVERNGEVSLTE
jgi:predicted DNA binding CopG/RHH family protein